MQINFSVENSSLSITTRLKSFWIDMKAFAF